LSYKKINFWIIEESLCTHEVQEYLPKFPLWMSSYRVNVPPVRLPQLPAYGPMSIGNKSDGF